MLQQKVPHNFESDSVAGDHLPISLELSVRGLAKVYFQHGVDCI